MATVAQRAHVGHLISELYARRSQLKYPPGDVRQEQDARDFALTEQMAENELAAGGTLEFDCSEMDAWVLKCAGLWHWPSPGYTGSHLATMPTYNNAKIALVGAIAVFGPGTGHHEALVWVPDPKHGNPILASHGEPGYDRITLADEAARQAGLGYPGVRFCSIAHL